MVKFKNYFSLLILSIITVIVSNCNTDKPESYFGKAVLNVNLMHGFANETLSLQLKSPSVKLTDDGGTATMKRKEVIDGKLISVEENYEKVKSLKETAETKNMLDASKSLHEYVIPVYKNEYTKLAGMYDNGASPEDIQTFTNSINEKYYNGYLEKFDKLIAAGKIYAEKNNIKVNWDVKTSTD